MFDIESVEVGTPATFKIGGDRYATEVTAVERFKTGARAGQVKAVEAGTHRFTPKTTKRGETYLVGQGGSGALWLGFAENYRDPHF